MKLHYRNQSYQFLLSAIIKANLDNRLISKLAAAGGFQKVSATIPENATTLLWLLQTLSQGRIICEYDYWLIK